MIKSILKVLDNIVAVLLALWAFCNLLIIDIFHFDLSSSDEYLWQAERHVIFVFNGLAILTIMFLLRKKWSWMQNFERIGWLIFILIVPYLLHEIPSIHDFYADNN